MFELAEIEELFKSEDLIKSRPKLQALLRNAAILHQEGVTPEQKKIALENIKAITMGDKQVKPKKQKATPAAPVSQFGPTVSNVKLKYSPVYQHYGISQDHWNAAPPEAHQELFNHHNAVMAGKVPGSEHIKSAVEQSKANMIKSMERLSDLFKELKKHI